MKFYFVIFIALLFNHQALANEPPKGKINGSTYIYNGIGWTFEIPSGWLVRSTDEIARVRGIAKELFIQTLKQDMPLSPTPLLYLHYGKNNRFTSDAELYDQSPANYEANADQSIMQLYEIFKSKGMKISSNKRKININGVSFIVYDQNILSPDDKKVLTNSMFYTALIDNIDFNMSYVCTDRNECKKIEASILGSSFTK